MVSRFTGVFVQYKNGFKSADIRNVFVLLAWSLGLHAERRSGGCSEQRQNEALIARRQVEVVRAGGGTLDARLCKVWLCSRTTIYRRCTLPVPQHFAMAGFKDSRECLWNSPIKPPLGLEERLAR